MRELDAEGIQAHKELEKKFDLEKQDRLGEYQERLRNAGSKDEFNKILAEYETAQLRVDQEMAKAKAKQTDKLDRDLKARRQKLKAQAEIARNQKFKEIEE